MNKTQRVLFRLMEDFDAICNANGIEYILIGGSALGAVRHGGFIPWDDDVDILVSREEFEKLDAAMKRETRADRKWVTEENTPTFHNPLGKYFDTTTTNLFRSLILDGSPNSSHLEVFIADPYPDSEEGRKRHNTLLWIYTELQNPYYPSANMGMPDGMLNRKLLEQYQADAKRRGLQVVLGEIRDELAHDGEECSSICQRWSYRPVVFKKEWLTDKTRIPFESASFPVGKDVVKRLMVNYDENWFLLPPKSKREIHESSENTQIAYAEHEEELEQICSDANYADLLYENKVDRRNRTFAYDDLDRCAASMKQAYLEALARRLSSRMEPFDPRKLGHFAEEYREYFSVQFHPRYRKYGLAANMDDALLESMLWTLLYQSRIKDTRDLMSLYPSFARSEFFAGACDKLWDLKIALYEGDSDTVRNCLDYLRGDAGMGDQIYVERAWVWMSVRSGDLTSAEDILRMQKCLASPDDAEISKYLGDAFDQCGDFAAAQALYKPVLTAGQNGMLVKDILSRGYFRGAVVKDTSLKVLDLLSEVDSAFEKESIPYITAGLVPKILQRKRFENFTEIQVYLLSEHMPAALDVLAKSMGPDRNLEYYGSNGSYPYFSVSYEDASSLSYQTNDDLSLAGKRLRVELIPLRKASAEIPFTLRIRERACSMNYRAFARAIRESQGELKASVLAQVLRLHELEGDARRDAFFRKLSSAYAVGSSKSLRVRDPYLGYAFSKLPYGLFGNRAKAILFGHSFWVSSNLVRYRNFMYPEIAGERRYPKVGKEYTLSGLGVTFEDVAASFPGVGESHRLACEAKWRVEELESRVAERVQVIDEVWDYAQSVFLDQEDQNE